MLFSTMMRLLNHKIEDGHYKCPLANELSNKPILGSLNMPPFISPAHHSPDGNPNRFKSNPAATEVIAVVAWNTLS